MPECWAEGCVSIKCKLWPCSGQNMVVQEGLESIISQVLMNLCYSATVIHGKTNVQVMENSLKDQTRFLFPLSAWTGVRQKQKQPQSAVYKRIFSVHFKCLPKCKTVQNTHQNTLWRLAQCVTQRIHPWWICFHTHGGFHDSLFFLSCLNS